MTVPDTWGLDLEDLLIPFGEAGPAAARAAAGGGWLDAFLLAAGCLQVVEDRLHASEGLLDRIAAHLDGADGAAGRLAGPVASAATVRRVAARTGRGAHRLQARRDLLLDLVVDLAGAATRPGGAPDAADLAGRVAQLLGPASTWPAVDAEACLRLPSCFRSFDQHPADVAELVARSAATAGRDLRAPVVVAGVRTSGSYLGPLAAAELRRAGHTDVRLVTLRPGERLDSSQRAAVAGTRRCLVVDDPPVSGAAVQRCIDELLAAGVAAGAVHLLLPLPEGWPIPPRLEHHQRTVVGSDDWQITRNLEPGALDAAAGALLAARGRRLVGPLVPVPDPVGGAPGGIVRTPREHRRAAFELTTVDLDAAEGAAPRRATLLVQGVGVGLFGHHDAVVLARLGGQVPDVLGVRDGLLFQLLGPAEATAGPLDVEAAVGYVAERHRSLRRPVDRAEAMAGRKAAWEVAALVVGQALGRTDPVLRLTTVQPLVKRLLQVDAPSVVDGRISGDRWVLGTCGGLVKLDAAEGAFSNRDLWTYDPVFDVAALADELGAAAEVRAGWERRTGTSIGASRWLLLRLVHAWDRNRLGGLPQPAFGRACTAALADFVGDLLLADLGAAAPTGPWCALDVDGVLETGVLAGGSAPGWDGGLALRALVAHGHRVVLATGRGVDEVADRRAAWGLPGAVAEYGAALVLGDGRVLDQRDAAGVAAVERGRRWLEDRAGVEVDPGHRFALRGWATDGGRRGPLSDADLAGVLAAAGGGLVAVPGEDQTDLVPVGISKATTVRRLLDLLDPGAGQPTRPLALAAGDGPADVELLALAGRAVVPAHAAAEVRAAATVPARHAYQAGLREGVAALLGHDPGGCGRCRPSVGHDDAALLTALSVREAGGPGVATRLGRLTWAAARPPRRRSAPYDSGHNSETPRIRQ